MLHISFHSQFLLNCSYDRNNLFRDQRRSLREATSEFSKHVRLLALNWSLDQPPSTIHRICSDRVQQRGDNHQTLRADSSSKSHEETIWKLIHAAQKLNPREVDCVVEMKLGESLEDSVKRAVKGCVAVMGLEMPSDEKIQEGLDMVRGYAPTVKEPDDPKGKKKPDVQYYGLLPEVDLEDLLDRALVNESQSNKAFWMQLKADQRVTKRPHVTIVHKDDIETEGDLWNRCIAVHEMPTATPPLFKCTLSHVLWDGCVMVITVEDFDVEAEGSSGSNEGREFVSNLPDDTRSRMHITVGTKDGDIKPVEAKTMVQKWRKGEELDKIKSFKLVDLIVYGRIKGISYRFS